MAETSKADAPHRMPYQMYFNALDLWGRVIASGCELSLKAVASASSAHSSLIAHTEATVQKVERASEMAMEASAKEAARHSGAKRPIPPAARAGLADGPNVEKSESDAKKTASAPKAAANASGPAKVSGDKPASKPAAAAAAKEEPAKAAEPVATKPAPSAAAPSTSASPDKANTAAKPAPSAAKEPSVAEKADNMKSFPSTSDYDVSAKAMKSAMDEAAHRQIGEAADEAKAKAKAERLANTIPDKDKVGGDKGAKTDQTPPTDPVKPKSPANPQNPTKPS